MTTSSELYVSVKRALSSRGACSNGKKLLPQMNQVQIWVSGHQQHLIQDAAAWA